MTIMLARLGPFRAPAIMPLPLTVQYPAFLLVVAAPDAVLLVCVQREGQAALSYRAAGADRLGSLDFRDGKARCPDREEELWVEAAAGS